MSIWHGQLNLFKELKVPISSLLKVMRHLKMVYSLKAVPAALQVTVVLQSCNKSGDKS
jgi:hypothetical protein